MPHGPPGTQPALVGECHVNYLLPIPLPESRLEPYPPPPPPPTNTHTPTSMGAASRSRFHLIRGSVCVWPLEPTGLGEFPLQSRCCCQVHSLKGAHGDPWLSGPVCPNMTSNAGGCLTPGCSASEGQEVRCTAGG